MVCLKPSPLLAIVLFAFAYSEASKNWRTELEWSRINFTWPSPKALNRALSTKSYIPENVAMAGIKFYNYKMYVALPRIRQGIPVTLAYTSFPQDSKTNPLLVPYPSWDMNSLDNGNCNNLISVQSMEIDRDGIMWVLDGMRTNTDLPDCPPKILLLDLSTDSVVRKYAFAKDLSNTRGGFLNDIVVDGDFAYITESSADDPGLIVYSKAQNKAWKLRDSSMFAERSFSGIRSGGWTQKESVNVDGIALSPQSKRQGERYVYYCPLTGFSLYRISTNILKDEDLSSGNSWRRQVTLVGNKTDATDGMVMDNKGTLYFGMLSKDGVGKWQSNDFIRDSQDFYPDTNDDNINGMIWPDSFTMDLKGNLFVLANGIHKFYSPDFRTINNDDIKFRIFKYHIGSKSYMYSS